MIFSGDFVFPNEFNEAIFSELGESFITKPKIVNFESTISYFNQEKITKGIPLSSSNDVIKAFKYLNIKCTSCANNHVTDFKYNNDAYLRYFTDEGITTIGIGKNMEKASFPFVFEEEKLIVLSFGWETIRCSAAKVEVYGVNPYRYKWVETQVLKYKKVYPAYSIVLFLHWNYEFETYPLPADRQFSYHLIDLGVDAIFGHHPHIINGYEVYKNKPIFYSLGNFYFPQVKYGKHQLNFRDSSLEGISVDFNGNLNDLRIYHHKQDKQGSFVII